MLLHLPDGGMTRNRPSSLISLGLVRHCKVQRFEVSEEVVVSE